MGREKQSPPIEIIGRDDEGHSLYIGELYYDHYVTTRNGSVCVRRRNAAGFDEQTQVLQSPETPDKQ